MQNERSGFFELTAPVLSGAPFAWGAILGADDENIPFIPPSPRATPAELGAGLQSKLFVQGELTTCRETSATTRRQAEQSPDRPGLSNRRDAEAYISREPKPSFRENLVQQLRLSGAEALKGVNV